MREIRRKLMAVMKKHHMDIKEFAEKCGMEEGRMERLLHGRGRLTMLEAGQRIYNQQYIFKPYRNPRSI